MVLHTFMWEFLLVLIQISSKKSWCIHTFVSYIEHSYDFFFFFYNTRNYTSLYRTVRLQWAKMLWIKKNSNEWRKKKKYFQLKMNWTAMKIRICYMNISYIAHIANCVYTIDQANSMQSNPTQSEPVLKCSCILCVFDCVSSW